MKHYFRKKRQVILALFLCLIVFESFGQTVTFDPLCRAHGQLTLATVKRVVDGDTVYFDDGKKVRLVGVNTPELDHKSGQHEPFALEAKRYLKSLIGHKVYWQASRNDEDRYGRKLYYLFDNDRISIASRLISKGLGYRIAIPPNTEYQDCLIRSEWNARKALKGLWRAPQNWQPKAGFTKVSVTITSITRNRGGWWLETNQDLVINLPRLVSELWSEQDVYSLKNKRIEARGWQHQRNSQSQRFKSWVLIVKHPNDLLDVSSDA
ncbi:thermonuclease family protein [Marinomonas balearica]|uniref:Endonuclease YncB(Thermonuclease family) n=1 Tax=Marinomonas balearica TaxID=491947 RepID=A0A4R6M2T3_9GAMM|nr:thermonuclease family protein [Marinomonas balearica]TDO95567.1 endonuclease YncB(thermonuclease family) [Marinomonas balearica]